MMTFADRLSDLATDALSNAMNDDADAMVKAFKTACMHAARRGQFLGVQTFSTPTGVSSSSRTVSSSTWRIASSPTLLESMELVPENQALFKALIEERVRELGLNFVVCEAVFSRQSFLVRIKAEWRRRTFNAVKRAFAALKSHAASAAGFVLLPEPPLVLE